MAFESSNEIRIFDAALRKAAESAAVVLPPATTPKGQGAPAAPRHIVDVPFSTPDTETLGAAFGRVYR